MQIPASTSRKIAIEDRVISLSEIAHKSIRAAQAVFRHKLLFAAICGVCILGGAWAFTNQPSQFESHAEVAVHSAMDFAQIEEPLQTVWQREQVLTSAAQRLVANRTNVPDYEALAHLVANLPSQLSVSVVDQRPSGKPISIQLRFRDSSAEEAQQTLAEIVTAGLVEFEQLDLTANHHPILHDSKRAESLGTLRNLINARDQLKQKLSDSMLQTTLGRNSLSPELSVPGMPETLRGSLPFTQSEGDRNLNDRVGAMYTQLLKWVTQPDGTPDRSVAQSESTRQLHTLNAQLLLKRMQDEIKYLRSRVALAELVGQPASPASSISAPLSSYLARFAVMGLLAGIASVLLIDTVQDRFHSSADVESVLGLHRLATLPAVQPVELKLDSTDVQHAESFACLSKVLETSPAPLHCIAVTSSGDGEGSDYVAFKLAAAAADSGKHTLFIAADLRSAELADKLGLSGASGLSDLLAGRCELSTSIQPASTAAGLDVLPCGTKTDQSLQLFASSAFEQLIDDLRHQYDQIVIHAPAAHENADAAVIGRVCDGLLLVVHGCRSKTAVTLRSRRQLASFGVQVTGAVVIRNHRWKSSLSDWQYNGLADARNSQLNSASRVDETPTHDGPSDNDSQIIDKPKLRSVA